MVIKLKEGCIVELDNIKIARVIQVLDNCWNIEISYFDEKKNPKVYLACKSKEEGNLLIDKLLDEIKDTKTIKFL